MTCTTRLYQGRHPDANNFPTCSFLPSFFLSMEFVRYNINSTRIIYIYIYVPRPREEGPRPLDFHFSKVDFTRTVKKFIVVEEEEKGERAIDERRWSFVRSVEKRRTRPATVYNTWNNNWFRCGARKCSEHRGAARRGFLSRNRLHGQRRSEKTAGMRREIFETVQPRCSSSLPNAQTDCPFRLLFTVAKRIANARTRTFLQSAVSFSPLSLLYYYVYVFLFSFPLFSPSFPFLLFFSVFSILSRF